MILLKNPMPTLKLRQAGNNLCNQERCRQTFSAQGRDIASCAELWREYFFNAFNITEGDDIYA